MGKMTLFTVDSIPFPVADLGIWEGALNLRCRGSPQLLTRLNYEM